MKNRTKYACSREILSYPRFPPFGRPEADAGGECFAPYTHTHLKQCLEQRKPSQTSPNMTAPCGRRLVGDYSATSRQLVGDWSWRRALWHQTHSKLLYMSAGYARHHLRSILWCPRNHHFSTCETGVPTRSLPEMKFCSDLELYLL